MKTKIIPNIKFKSVLDGYKSVKKRNEHFNELNNEGKRLEIAWDALNLLLSDQIKPSRGCYWSEDISKIEGNSFHLQNIFNKKQFYRENYCKVCQRGALMLSLIRLGNSISSEDVCRENGSRDNIKGFSLEKFIEMENEYEHNIYMHPYNNNTKEKMANIFCNILVNGDFNRYDKSDYLIIKNV